MAYGAAAGMALSAIGSIKAGNDQASSLHYQAEVARQNAQNSLIAAKLNADKSMMQASKIQGLDIANYGASGVSADSGSVLAVLASNTEKAEMDKQNIIYGGQIRAINYENQASIDTVAASRAKTAGYLGALGGGFLAGSKLYGTTGGSGGLDEINKSSLTDVDSGESNA